MGRIEKTVFISYRRTNFWIALAIFQNLHANGYDVFFDYKSIPSGDFEQVIIENIKSRAHFIIVLTPSALERCNEPGDWLRREIETAIENQRNIIPLMMESFDFGSPATMKALTGNLENLKKYNALGIPAEYFDEAMIKLRSDRFLNRPLESVSHPVSEITRQVTELQKTAASEAPQVEKEKLTAQEWLELSYVFEDNQNFDEAVRCNNEAIRIQPEFSVAYYNLGNLLSNQKLKLHVEAENAYRKAIELDPFDKDAYCNLGILLNELKRYDEAEIAYRTAIKLDPLEANLYYNLGVLLNILNRYEEAEATFHKAIELNPSNANTFYNLGFLLNNLQRFSEAKDSYLKAIELNPSDAASYYNLGNLLKNLEQYNEAEAAYRKAIELNEASATEEYWSDAVAYSNLGNLLKDLKRYEEAETAYRKAIELNPSEAAAYYNLGIMLRLINRAEDAIPLLEKLIEIAPGDFNPYLALASINKQSGKNVYPNHIAKARQLIPEDDWHNQACLESVCGNFDLAFEHLRQAAQAEQFDPTWAWDDPDLQWIRDDPRFTEIVGPLPK